MSIEIRSLFKLVVKDSNSGQAIDSINILVKNAAVAESPSTNGPQTLPKEQGAQLNQGPTSQETAPSSGSGSTAGHDTTSIENHSPTAETLQIVSIDQNKPLSISIDHFSYISTRFWNGVIYYTMGLKHPSICQ